MSTSSSDEEQEIFYKVEEIRDYVKANLSIQKDDPLEDKTIHLIKKKLEL